MNLWHYLSRYYRPGSITATSELARSYQRLFTGHGSERDAQIVLTDFAAYTGFYRVNGPGIGGEDRAFSDGMRAAYGRLHGFLRMTDDERRQLEEAARQEALAQTAEE